MIRPLIGALAGLVIAFFAVWLLFAFVFTAVHNENTLPFFFVALPLGTLCGYRLSKRKRGGTDKLQTRA